MNFKNYPLLLSIGFSAVLYLLISYDLDRTNFLYLISLFAGLFAFYFIGYKSIQSEEDVRLATAASLVFRVLVLFSIPNLSDDFYRFYWDGLLQVNGISPFLHLPSEFISGSMQEHGIAAINSSLFNNLNSPEYYTIYPPVSQWVFALSAWLFPNSLTGATVVMKVCLLLFEMGTIWALFALAKHFNFKSQLPLLYALNPLVIIELVGNVHFEAAMIFFLLLGILFYCWGWWKSTAIALAFSISSKLIPLIILPFFIRRLGVKKTVLFMGIIAATCLLLFAPILDPTHLSHFGESLQLYFGKFEFNASFYCVIHTMLDVYTDWPGHSIAGALGALITLAAVLFFAAREKHLTNDSLLRQAVGSLGIYFLLASTIHPWYISTLIALSCLSCFRFPIVWSALIVLTYATYMTFPYAQNFHFIAFEYIVLILFLLFENRSFLQSLATRSTQQHIIEQQCALTKQPKKGSFFSVNK